jgi:hypothetical protein
LWTLAFAQVHRCHCRHDSLRACCTSVLQFALALGKIEVINQLYGCKSTGLSSVTPTTGMWKATGKQDRSAFSLVTRLSHLRERIDLGYVFAIEDETP